MKKKLILAALLLLLGGFLFFSNQYDYVKNSRKINMYPCLQTEFNPFPPNFTAIDSNGVTIRKPNRYEDGTLSYKYLKLTELPDDLFKDYSTCIENLFLHHKLIVYFSF